MSKSEYKSSTSGQRDGKITSYFKPRSQVEPIQVQPTLRQNIDIKKNPFIIIKDFKQPRDYIELQRKFKARSEQLSSSIGISSKKQRTEPRMDIETIDITHYSGEEEGFQQQAILRIPKKPKKPKKNYYEGESMNKTSENSKFKSENSKLKRRKNSDEDDFVPIQDSSSNDDKELEDEDSSSEIKEYDANQRNYFKNQNKQDQKNYEKVKNKRKQIKVDLIYDNHNALRDFIKEGKINQSLFNRSASKADRSKTHSKGHTRSKGHTTYSTSKKEDYKSSSGGAHQSSFIKDEKMEYTENQQTSMTEPPSLIQRKRAKPNQNPNVLKIIHNPEIMQKIRQVIYTYNDIVFDRRPTRSYSILEDLKLIDAMSRKDEFGFQDVGKGFGPNFWINVVNAGFIDRALESTRDRVKRFIRNVSDKDIESILHWIQKHNTVDGFLYFVGSKKRIRGDRFFSHVSKEDPLTTKKKKFSGRQDLLASDSDEEDVATTVKKEEYIGAPVKQENVKKEHNIEDYNNFDQLKNHQLENHESEIDIEDFEIKSQFSSELISGGSIEILYWKTKKNNQDQIKSEVKEEYGAEPSQNTYNQSHEEIDKNIVYLQNKYIMRPKDIAKILESVCYDLEDAELYFQDQENNQWVLWSEENDKVLRTSVSQFEAKFMQLRKIKGDQRIKRRLNYKNYQLNFMK